MTRSLTEASPGTELPGGRGASFSGHAFGMNIRAGFQVAGLPSCEPLEGGGRHTSLQLETEAIVEAEWEGRSPERIREWHDGSKVEGGLDLDPELGYRMTVEGYGAFTVSADGCNVRCAPPSDGSRAWEECLIGQVLPLAAVLRGVEVLHASAVSLGDRGVAFVGASTAGKTSLAVNLVARGARLVTDDVLGLAMEDGRLRCFPGAGVVSLRHAEATAMGERWRSLGEVSVHGPEAVRVALDRDDRPLPLAALYFLERGVSDATRIEPIEGGDPCLLLASSFNFSVRDRGRLINQLETCAALSAQVPQFRLSIGADTSAGALSEQLLRNLDELPPRGGQG